MSGFAQVFERGKRYGRRMPEDILHPSRKATDESLHTERENTDREFARTQASIESTADAVVKHARNTADVVLQNERATADQRLEARSGPHARETVREERARDDRAVLQERALADATLQDEREDSARVLAKLLPLERESTDRSLLTERGRSDEALADRDDFMSIVSHDLRNLLSGIVSSTELLEMAPGAGEQTLELTNRIQRYAARMNRLIGDLLDVGSIDAGRLSITPTRGDLALVLAESVEIFAGSAATKGVTMTATPGPSLLADFDHDRMLQVLANLLSNALKFTPRGGTIQVSGAVVDGRIHLSVADTGIGIPAPMLDVIFERFWQVNKEDRRGVGLGLYIARCIVEAHGSTILAASTPGAGTTFTISHAAAE